LKYTGTEKTAESVIYDVEYDEIGHVYIGNAVLSVTRYADEAFEYTLIISIGDYSLLFVDSNYG